jgi:hypothetical protein
MEHGKFINACDSGDIETFKSLDYSKIDIHFCDELAFLSVCRRGRLDIARFLLTLEPEQGQINIHIHDEWAFRYACYDGHLNTVQFLLDLEETHGSINIHAGNEWAFKYACYDGHLNVVQFLLTLEETHGRINIHNGDEDALRYACQNDHLGVVKFLLSLEPERGWFDFARNGYLFNNVSFHVNHILIRHDPKHNWQNVKGYDKYCSELDQIVECLATLHQKMIQIETDILELNVIGIIKEFIL